MADTFDAPQSANEALLQNMLGADNVIREPQSRNEAILKAILEGLATIPAPYVAPPQSRIEELLVELWENGGGGGEAVLIEKTFTENGYYTAEEYEADGFSAVEVDVPTPPAPTLVQKSITENGTYAAQDETPPADGFSQVTVNVPTNPPAYFATGNASVYFEDHVVPETYTGTSLAGISGAPNLKSYKCYAQNAHNAITYQVWDANKIEEIECPYITNLGFICFWIYDNTDPNKVCTRTFGSIGNPVTSIDSRAYAFNQNVGTGWTAIYYVDAQTFADIPAAVANNATGGANYLTNIIYKNSTTGEVITA